MYVCVDVLGVRALVSGGLDEPRLLPVHVPLDLVVDINHHLITVVGIVMAAGMSWEGVE